MYHLRAQRTDRTHLKRFRPEQLEQIYNYQKANNIVDLTQSSRNVHLIMPPQLPPYLELPPPLESIPAAKAAYQNRILVKRLSESAQIPVRQSVGAAGYDLFSDVDIDIEGQRTYAITTNIQIQLGFGTYGRIAPRSGLAFREGIDIMAGVIDTDFQGAISVVLIKHTPGIFQIRKGMRIAQLIIERIELPEMYEVNDIGAPTARSTGGFGSTGK